MPTSRIYYTYILTNFNRSVFYTGATNDLASRLIEHWIGKPGSFTTTYQIYYLIWWEATPYVLNAIEGEKRIKRCNRQEKAELIASLNPDWRFMNEEILGNWPPTPIQIADVLSRQGKF
ncbi:MAG: GIY-YIG nuclease family protein [Sphingobacteriales bacterium]|nr:MAG: GIY-YIG nuclease family protein [Sphingobacteriales bacterium]